LYNNHSLEVFEVGRLSRKLLLGSYIESIWLVYLHYSWYF